MNYNESLSDYEKCIALNPQYVPAYLRRGLIYTFQKKDSAKAKSDFEKILSIEKIGRAHV